MAKHHLHKEEKNEKHEKELEMKEHDGKHKMAQKAKIASHKKK